MTVFDDSLVHVQIIFVFPSEKHCFMINLFMSVVPQKQPLLFQYNIFFMYMSFFYSTPRHVHSYKYFIYHHYYEYAM